MAPIASTLASEPSADPGKRSVALLLAAAAVVAAGLGAAAALHVGEASSSWAQAVRQEMKRALADIEDVRHVYTDEARAAFRVLQAEVRMANLQEAMAAATDPVVSQALAREIFVLEQLLGVLRPASAIAADPRYAAGEDGYDVALRLADLRAQNPDLVAIDPEVTQRAGDGAADRARLTVLAGIPVGVTFLVGALAGTTRRWRRALLAAGVVLLVVSVVMGVAVGVGLVGLGA